MSVNTVRDAFNEISPSKCARVTMDYLDGGRRSRYLFHVGAEPIEVIWDRPSVDSEIAAAALAALQA